MNKVKTSLAKLVQELKVEDIFMNSRRNNLNMITLIHGLISAG